MTTAAAREYCNALRNDLPLFNACVFDNCLTGPLAGNDLLTGLEELDDRSPERRCSGQGDPHITKFDGNRFDDFTLGERLFYQNKGLKVIGVQVETPIWTKNLVTSELKVENRVTPQDAHTPVVSFKLVAGVGANCKVDAVLPKALPATFTLEKITTGAVIVFSLKGPHRIELRVTPYCETRPGGIVAGALEYTIFDHSAFIGLGQCFSADTATTVPTKCNVGTPAQYQAQCAPLQLAHPNLYASCWIDCCAGSCSTFDSTSIINTLVDVSVSCHKACAANDQNCRDKCYCQNGSAKKDCCTAKSKVCDDKLVAPQTVQCRNTASKIPAVAAKVFEAVVNVCKDRDQCTATTKMCREDAVAKKIDYDTECQAPAAVAPQPAPAPIVKPAPAGY